MKPDLIGAFGVGGLGVVLLALLLALVADLARMYTCERAVEVLQLVNQRDAINVLQQTVCKSK